MIRPIRATRLAFSLTAAGALAALAACTPPAEDTAAMALVGSMQDTPPGAPEGTCWRRIVSPALIETVTEQILVQPASAATDAGPETAAIYRTETRQRIVNEREVTWFEAPCPEDMTTEAIATLQRALAVRDFYDGPVTGQIERQQVRRWAVIRPAPACKAAFWPCPPPAHWVYWPRRSRN